MIINIEKVDSFYDQLVNSLKNGNIIAFPTDTVYGLAVDGLNAEALEKLANLKRRRDKPFTFFITKSRFKDYARLVKRKIIEYFVPGPLTVILRKQKDVSLPFISEYIGLRIPQVDFIIKILSLYNRPLAVTSANISDQVSMSTAAEISQHLIDVDIIIDGGERLSKPSTVLDLTLTPPLVKRKGVIPILEIERVYGRNVVLDTALKFNVLFVCSGNSCRSPMAEGIFKTLIDEEHCEVQSAGTLPMERMPPSQYAQDVVKEYGGSIVDHLSQTISKKLIDWADLILVMGYNHYTVVLEIAPKAAVKTFLLKEYKRRVKYNEISDPAGKDINAYKEAAGDMLPSLKLVAKDIKRRFSRGKE
jgi:tRNA threonylcarbamoyl adenosine modification protein (Sua5/YciO/YrdC/YwlC family)